MRLAASARRGSKNRRGTRGIFPPLKCRKQGPNWDCAECTPENCGIQDSSVEDSRRAAASKLVTDAERNNRIESERRSALINLGLLGQNISLDGGIGADGPAIETGEVASAAAQSQSGARRPLVRGSRFEGDTESAIAAGDEIAKPQKKHGRGLVKGELAHAGDGVGRITHVSCSIEDETLAAGNRSIGIDLVSVVEQHPGAQMKIRAG